MPRQRERFERTDVPRENPNRNLIALVVIAAVAVAMVLLCSTLWARVQREVHLGDNNLEDAISGVSAASSIDGHAASTDSFDKVLVLTTSSLGDGGCTLSGAYALVVNETQGTAVMATIPTTVKVTSSDTDYTLADLCSKSGTAAVIVPLFSATNVSFDHVIVTKSSVDDLLTLLAGASSSSADGFVSENGSLLDTMTTDMSAEKMLTLAGELKALGVSNIGRVDASTYAETTQADDGTTTDTGYQLVDIVALEQSVGLLIS